MRLRFLGKNSVPGDSPTLYATDRHSFVVQGWKVTDPEVLAKLDPPADETCVEVPAALFVHLAKDGLRGAIAHWVPPSCTSRVRVPTSSKAQTLHTNIGGPDVMRGQLDRLLASISLPRLNLGIIPLRSEYHIWPGNAFIMFDDRMVMVETYSAELTITQPRELALYAKAFALLHRSAVYGIPARALITKALAELS